MRPLLLFSLFPHSYFSMYRVAHSNVDWKWHKRGSHVIFSELRSTSKWNQSNLVVLVLLVDVLILWAFYAVNFHLCLHPSEESFVVELMKLMDLIICSYENCMRKLYWSKIQFEQTFFTPPVKRYSNRNFKLCICIKWMEFMPSPHMRFQIDESVCTSLSI